MDISATNKPCTVAHYIKTHNVKTEQRFSRKGTKLIKVFYPSGEIREYPMNHIHTTMAPEN